MTCSAVSKRLNAVVTPSARASKRGGPSAKMMIASCSLEPPRAIFPNELNVEICTVLFLKHTRYGIVFDLRTESMVKELQHS